MLLDVPVGLSRWWQDEAGPLGWGRAMLSLLTKPPASSKGQRSEAPTGREDASVEPTILEVEPRSLLVRVDQNLKADLRDPIAAALCRAGWLRPEVDPIALSTLIALRKSAWRVEFILDTSAMDSGIAHWLAELFADQCDMVVTAVTLRELQDLGDQRKKDKSSVYYASNRFRECSSYPRMLWRELELEDTTLLLSRGHGGDKSSESDTTLLRAVRASIREGVPGLERYFVCSDTNLARRAASELPEGSVIAGYTPKLRLGAVYAPCAWFPGQSKSGGSWRTQRSLARLVWECLAIGDGVTLKTASQVATFRAYSRRMFPSDYKNPWVSVAFERDGATEPPQGVADVQQPPAKLPIQEFTALRQMHGSEPAHPFGIPWTKGAVIDENWRLPAKLIFDLLHRVAMGTGETSTIAAIPISFQRASADFLSKLEFGKLSEEGVLTFGPSQPALRHAWLANDLDGIFDLLRPWAPLGEWAALDAPPKRPDNTIKGVRALVSDLGQGMVWNGQWRPGGARPTLMEVDRAIASAMSARGSGGLPVFALLIEVFLFELKVAPGRVVRAWDRLVDTVLRRYELRQGGTSSGRNKAEVVETGEWGWRLVKVDLEAVQGYRDLVLRSHPNE